MLRPFSEHFILSLRWGSVLILLLILLGGLIQHVSVLLSNRRWRKESK